MREPKKYQEALDKAKNKHKDYNYHYPDYVPSEIDILQELIDEITPKKLLNKRKIDGYVNCYVGECPKCGKTVRSFDFRPCLCSCNQAIDWSDE